MTYMANKYLLILGLVVTVAAICGIAFFVANTFFKNPISEEKWESYMKNKGIASSDSQIEIKNVEEPVSGIVSFDSYEKTQDGWTHYRLVYANIETGEYAIISEYQTSGASGEDLIARMDNVAIQTEGN